MQKFVQAQKFALSGSGVTSSATTVVLQTFATPDGTLITDADLGTINYCTFEPGGSKEEIFSFTNVTQNANGTATLTGVVRGLKFVSPYDADSALRQQHSGGSIVVLSNNPQMLDEFLSASNDETITGEYTYTSTKQPKYDTHPTFTDDEALVDKKYVDETAIAGGADASTTVKGISKTSVAPVSPTNPITVGDNDDRVPTQDENDALVGTEGIPQAANPFVTAADVSESIASKVIRRKSDSNVTVPTTPTASTDAASKGYVDGKENWIFISDDTISGSSTSVQASDTSIIPNDTKFIVYQATGHSLEGTNYANQTAGNILLINGLIDEGFIVTGSDSTASATSYEGIKASISGLTLTCETLGFNVGGGRSAFINGTVNYFK